MKDNPTWLQNIRNCKKCHEQGLLYKDDQKREAYPVLFESGNFQSKIIFILEAPNFADSFDPDKRRLTYDAETDPTGRFVRKCLRKYLLLNPEDVYFTNAVLCLPKRINGKYPVRTLQMANCAPNIREMIDSINPCIIVTMGHKALSAIKKVQRHVLYFGSSVGTPHQWYGRTLFPMGHPGDLGRANRPKPIQEQDFIRLAEIVSNDEIPQSERMASTDSRPLKTLNPRTYHDTVEYNRRDSKMSEYSISKDVMVSYSLFKTQKDLIMAELLKIDPTGKAQLHWRDLSPENIYKKKNWFSGFIPSAWGKHAGSGFGVSFWFYYNYDKDSNTEFLRLNVGAESPLKGEFKQDFKQKIMAHRVSEWVKLYP